MSLATFALRTCTVMALMGRTDAENRVADSRIVPVEGSDLRGLSVAVYVDQMKASRGLADVGAGDGEARLTLELVVTSNATPESFSLPLTDDGMELGLDLLEQQVRLALLDAENPWSVLWGRLVIKPGEYAFERGADKRDNGLRLAGREVTMNCGLVAEPPIGAPLPPIWVDFLAALENEPEFAEVYDKIAAAVHGQTLAAWRAAQAAQGLTANAVRGIGVTPPFETVADPAPQADQLTIADDLGETTVIVGDD